MSLKRDEKYINWVVLSLSNHFAASDTRNLIIKRCGHGLALVIGVPAATWIGQFYGHWDDERRLNMIPGGRAGLRYLREHSILSKGVVAAPDERDGFLDAWLSDNQGESHPPITLTESWQDEAWAAAQICSRSDRLSVSQITAIRDLATSLRGHEPRLT